MLVLIVSACVIDKSGEGTESNGIDRILKDTVELKKVVLKNNSVEPMNLDSFLENPFDLVAFKAKKKGSHSSGANFKDYHFQPEGNGRNWSFFGFQPSRPNKIRSRGDSIRSENAGYKWRLRKQSPRFVAMGLILKTFQPENKYQNQYTNPAETLIEVFAEYNDYDLPELAFIGLKRNELLDKLGSATFTKEGCSVYTSGHNALILKIGIEVDAIRYVRLLEPLTIESEMKEIYSFN